MKVKFNVAQGSAVFTYENNDVSLMEAVYLLQRDEVISITVTKQTPTQYLKTQRVLNETVLIEEESGKLSKAPLCIRRD